MPEEGHRRSSLMLMSWEINVRTSVSCQFNQVHFQREPGDGEQKVFYRVTQRHKSELNEKLISEVRV